MRLLIVPPLRVLLTCMAIGLLVFSTLTQALGEETPLPVKSTETPSTTPSLAEVVYQAGMLAQQLVALKATSTAVDNLQEMDQRLSQAKVQVNVLEARLGALNADDLQSYQQLAALKVEVLGEADSVDKLSASVADDIHEVEGMRRQWVATKKKWAQWHALLGDELALKSVAAAFTRAGSDIDEALGLISTKLEPMLAIQQKAGDIAARFIELTDRINATMLQQRGGALRSGTPTIFSTAYLRQLIELINEPRKMVKALPPPDPVFFADNGWVILLQAVGFVVMLTLLRRYRPQLIERGDRRFLGKRPVSVSLFVSIFTLSFLYGPQPTLWRILIECLSGVATARLATAFVREPWIKRAVYILVVVMIGFQLLLIFGVPLAVVRLYILTWTVAGLIYYGWRARKGAAAGLPAWQVWLLRLVVVVFGVIAATDIVGLGGFSAQIMDGALRTAMLLLMGWAMIRLARVALDLGAESLPIGKLVFLRSRADEIFARIILASNILIVAFVAANLLVAWTLYAIPMDAIQAFLSFGLTLGGQKITIGLVLVAAFILYGTFVLSWSLQSLLMDKVLNRGQVDAGARISIVRLFHYALVLVGFLIALSALGFELKNVTIIGGALGVGIGFGMQAIVNNFVSGLILLFERPIKVGDFIQLNDGQQGRVLNLGLRATTVQTLDRAEIVVPNGDLISSPVTNWTLGDRSMRLIIPVGVAYGSDVETVMRVLLRVATDNDQVLKDPQPKVLFLNFGESSLDFELRVWIAEFDTRFIIQSALVQEIDRGFRAEGVEIPFPQRDLHLRSVDGKAADHLKGDPSAPAEPISLGTAPVPESD